MAQKMLHSLDLEKTTTPLLTVWRIEVRDGQHPSLAGNLDAVERARRLRFRDPAVGARWERTHAAMRLILAAHLGLDPAEVVYLPGDGKPRLETGPRVPADFDFNLTHSGAWAWLALARGCAVGIDLERIRALDWQAMVRHVCSPEEARMLEDAPAPERPRLFHRLWVRKEALLKAAGTGLSGARLPDVEAGSGPWRVSEVPAPIGYVGAIATSAPAAPVEWRDFAELEVSLEK